MTYHYHGIDAEESILTKSLPNLGTWALPNFFIKFIRVIFKLNYRDSVKTLMQQLLVF